ncbi:cytochrome-c oxidase, cbb3-type subunit III [Pseudohalocynthiibacter aestuariivivens]|jgi:cytochrome c oxidase cbb3-type subunit III|uniref:Cbb3-type cytochrome c oxidase subunit n=1 Tax=Pseudohalocynthiibacter aestuariivivens TaxID=1591409 RepID=A0ABV5JI24_9RHOB|nr:MULTISPECIES: cytochrome-c oxidase, cbb3-type subunit III [Pseudohalocynthiibacter]MBS9717405.1 cytochrome-c oxidase, cbb3-type subunit III [Pseudohalocynthiibacter aestuariivivens]MCK0102261.1 cytochrome-c oxidase, cbb3-type subunit III [Pseudohalocynthiibacter sp. F2068]
MTKKPQKTEKHEIETTGHSWDGIEEFNNPLPRWWLWTFYLTIIWGIGYVIAYPAWPLISGATPGVLGYSTRAEVAADIEEFDTANAGIEAKLVGTELTALSEDPELLQFAANAGRSIFATNCSTCHGSGAAGAKGYPNLLDDDWLWGGDIDAIYATVNHGIRNETDPDARFSQMPAFGEFLSEEEIAQVVNHVMAISGQEADTTLASAGATVFMDNCASCHMDEGTGDREQGAPNLTDAIWLYGGDVDTLTETVSNSRYGVMPNWNTRLSDADVRAVAAYVHQLGGGE